jgi:hydrogenase-4 component H
LTDDFELAVSNKQDLYQRATFALQGCTVCARPFITVKELNYAMALTIQSGVPETEVEANRSHFETCPECKRKQSILNPAKTPFGKYLNEGMPK